MLRISTTLEKWTDLGLKRALHEAAKGGYHRLLWTPGSKQADRYKLSNQVDHVSYHPKNNIFAAFKHGRPVVQRSIHPDELPSLIGKETADKLLKTTPHPSTGFHDLAGTDMDIGGHGMRGYYDNIIPKRLLALAKEHDPDADARAFQGQERLADRWISVPADHRKNARFDPQKRIQGVCARRRCRPFGGPENHPKSHDDCQGIALMLFSGQL